MLREAQQAKPLEVAFDFMPRIASHKEPCGTKANYRSSNEVAFRLCFRHHRPLQIRGRSKLFTKMDAEHDYPSLPACSFRRPRQWRPQWWVSDLEVRGPTRRFSLSHGLYPFQTRKLRHLQSNDL